LASAGAYVSEFLRTKKYGIGMRSRDEDKEYGIGMRSRAEDKEYGLVCACAAPKTKNTDWYALARLRTKRRNRLAR